MTQNSIPRLRIYSAVAFAFFLSVVAAQGQSGSRKFQQVAISPDGSQVARVEQSLDAAGEPVTGDAIYVLALGFADAKPRRISAEVNGAAASDDTIAWSPDSK